MISTSDRINNPNFFTDSRKAEITRDCLHTLLAFFQPGQVTQLMAMEVDVSGFRLRKSVGGYFDFDHLQDMADTAADLSGRSKGVFFTLNPLIPDVLARRRNRVDIVSRGEAASDQDVASRNWLMIDADPTRPSGISSTDTEKGHAWERIQALKNYLHSEGFPSPIVADSGNGYHLYFRVELSVDSDIPSRFLKSLTTQFSTPNVTIDTSVASASQLTKLFGTLVCKGDLTVERPHRRSRIVEVPPSVIRLESNALTQLLPVESGAALANVSTSHAGERILWRARRYLQTLPSSISGQRGHDRLFEAACRLIQGFDLNIEDAMPLLREYNERAEPPWGDADIRHKLEQADTQDDTRRRGYLLQETARIEMSDTRAISSVSSTIAGNLEGPRFPISIPDFVPMPTERGLGNLKVSQIERGPGRPAFESAPYIDWMIHTAIWEQQRSPVIIPAPVMASGITGANQTTGWQRKLLHGGRRRYSSIGAKRRLALLREGLSIASLKLATAMETESSELDSLTEQAEILTVQYEDIQWQIPSESCPETCPLHGVFPRHDHYQFAPSASYLGTLAGFATESGDRQFIFDFSRRSERASLLDSLIKSGKLFWAYIPVQLFGQACGLSVRQIRTMLLSQKNQSSLFQFPQRPLKQ